MCRTLLNYTLCHIRKKLTAKQKLLRKLNYQIYEGNSG